MNPRRRETAFVTALAIAFACFTWRGVTMFFSDDDVMNMYKAWTTPAGDIVRGLLLPWTPVLRPAGTAVYRVFYELFGFHPLPLYVFCWLLLIVNVFVAWRFFRALTPPFAAVIAVALTLVHGTFQDLYLSAGTIYDQLCFLFTALAVTVYARGGRWSGVWTCVFCLLAIDSKESGAAVPVILLLYEGVYHWKDFTLQRIRSIAPVFAVLFAIVAALVTGRIPRTPDLAGNGAYHAHLDLSVWLTHVASYFGLLLYREVAFNAEAAGIVLLAMLALAVLLRSRAMIFGWLFFVVAVTPVALIPQRPGYVLYVPLLGLGLWGASLFPVKGFTVRQAAIAGGVAIVILSIHAKNWPPVWQVSESSEWRLSNAMRHSYPVMKPAARILFADDFPADNGYDDLFNLRLLYHDPLIEVARLKGSAGQRPDGKPYDHVFTTTGDSYAELDPKDVNVSIRLNILHDYPPALEFNTRRQDSIRYAVSGLLPSSKPGDGWWTTKSASLKFQPVPAGSALSMTWWVPEFVAAAPRTLTVMVGGVRVGSALLNRRGENKGEFSVPAGTQTDSGFTIVRLDVDHPYTKDGQEYGVVLLRAAFRVTP
ncbi:MAG TPA: hypothetical protein VHC90_07810 [Bryobacteraceae bacterium]|nr:hypothetical protein [Bryobacteraceae bacterium]